MYTGEKKYTDKNVYCLKRIRQKGIRKKVYTKTYNEKMYRPTVDVGGSRGAICQYLPYLWSDLEKVGFIG